MESGRSRVLPQGPLWEILGAPTTHNPLGSSLQAGFVFIGGTARLPKYPIQMVNRIQHFLNIGNARFLYPFSQNRLHNAA